MMEVFVEKEEVGEGVEEVAEEVEEEVGIHGTVATDKYTNQFHHSCNLNYGEK